MAAVRLCLEYALRRAGTQPRPGRPPAVTARGDGVVADFTLGEEEKATFVLRRLGPEDARLLFEQMLGFAYRADSERYNMS